MGFNFGDLLTVAEGAIERDRQHTDADLKIRGQMLVADKQSYINRKNKKYDSELAAFEAEDSKVRQIKALNASMPDDGTGSAHDYAVKYNMILYPNFLNLSSDNQTKFLASTKNAMAGENGTGTLDYNNTTDKSKKYLEAEINNVESAASEIYTNKLLDAKGNSFLINQITGIEKKPLVVNDKEISDKVEEQMKALNIIKEINKNDNFKSKKLQGTTFTSTDGVVDFWSNATTAEQETFEKTWNTDMKSVTWKGIDNQEATSSITDIFASLGAETKAFYTIDNVNEKNIIKLNAPGRVISHYIEAAFEAEKKKLDAASAYNHFKNNPEKYHGSALGNIYHLADEAVIYKAIKNNIVDRSRYLIGDHFQISGTDGKPEAVTLVPLTLLDINNNFTTFSKNKEEKNILSSLPLDRREVKSLAKAWGNIFSTEEGYNNVLKMFKVTGEINKHRYAKYKENPNAGMAYIAKMMNQKNILGSQAGATLWMQLALAIDRDKLPEAMQTVLTDIEDRAGTDGFSKKGLLLPLETTVNGESAVKYWSPDEKKWKQITKSTWDKVDEKTKNIIKVNHPKVYEILISFE